MATHTDTKRVVQVPGEGLEAYFYDLVPFGGGANGSVHKTWISDNSEVTFDPDNINPVVDTPDAVTKIIDLSKLAPKEIQRALLEVQHLEEITHENIIKLLDSAVFRDDSRGIHVLNIVTEYCRTDLYELSWKTKNAPGNKGHVPEQIVAEWIYQILLPLRFLHNETNPWYTIHRDLKPENIFVDFNGLIKLADFGQAKTSSGGQRHTVAIGTEGFNNPPEVYNSNGVYERPLDIWGIGCIILDFCKHKDDTQSSPFPKSIWDLDETLYTPPEPLSFYSEGLRDLVQGCLQFNPKDRLSVIDCLASPLIVDAQRRVDEIKRMIVQRKSEDVELENQQLKVRLSKSQAENQYLRGKLIAVKSTNKMNANKNKTLTSEVTRITTLANVKENEATNSNLELQAALREIARLEVQLISQYAHSMQSIPGAIKISRNIIVEIENADILKTLTISKMIGYDDGFKGPLEVLGIAGIFPDLVQVMRPKLVSGNQYAIYTFKSQAERERSDKVLKQWVSPIGATFACDGTPSYIPPRYMTKFNGPLPIQVKKHITDAARTYNATDPPFTLYIHSRVSVPSSVLPKSGGGYPPLPAANRPSVGGISFPLVSSSGQEPELVSE